jgi:hypothetical protein
MQLREPNPWRAGGFGLEQSLRLHLREKLVKIGARIVRHG